MLNSRWKTLHTDVSNALWPCSQGKLPPSLTLSLVCVCVCVCVVGGGVGWLESFSSHFPPKQVPYSPYCNAFKSTFLVDFESMHGRIFLNPQDFRMTEKFYYFRLDEKNDGWRVKVTFQGQPAIMQQLGSKTPSSSLLEHGSFQCCIWRPLY